MWIVPPILAACLLLSAQDGETAGVRIAATLGYGGYVVPGRWVPLRVQVSGAPASARLEVCRAGSPVETFPYRAQETCRIECPVFIDETGGLIEVRLAAGRHVVAKRVLDTTARIFPGHLVLAVNIAAPVQQAISRALMPGETVAVVGIDPADLPRQALAYDGVNGLVATDPGAVLSPAQTQALRSWLAGGGRMVLCRARPAGTSIVAGMDLPAATAGGEAGLGGVIINETDPVDQADRWREMLALVPYARTARLTAGKCFPDDVLPPDRPGRPRELPLVLGAWAAAFFLAGLLAGRRKALLYLLPVTLLSTLAAIPAGHRLACDWRRGATVRTRAVILPAGGEILVNTRIDLGPHEAKDAVLSPSPWGASVRLGRIEEGWIRPRAVPSAVWRHGPASPVFSVRSGGSADLNLVGCLPASPGSEAGFLVEPAKVARWDGRQWRERMISPGGGDSWRDIEGSPRWLGDDEGWLTALAQRIPAASWLVGRGPLPGLALAVQGSPSNSSCWVRPLMVGVNR